MTERDNPPPMNNDKTFIFTTGTEVRVIRESELPKLPPIYIMDDMYAGAHMDTFEREKKEALRDKSTKVENATVIGGTIQWYGNRTREGGIVMFDAVSSQLYPLSGYEVRYNKHSICSICGAHDSSPCMDKSGEAKSNVACNCDLPSATIVPSEPAKCPTCGGESMTKLNGSMYYFLDFEACMLAMYVALDSKGNPIWSTKKQLGMWRKKRKINKP